MANLDVVTVKNEKAGSVELAPSIFETKVKPHLYHAEVTRQLALRRQGTHSTKNRALVSGGGAKPYRQKGTGRARQGTIRAPQWAGGGVVFGPVPRGHAHKLPKKVRRGALTSALSQRLQESAITVIENLELDEFKTRRIAELLANLGLTGQKVLLVLAEPDQKIEASARNIPGLGLIRSEGLNVYDVLRHEKLLLTRAAVEALDARMAGKGEEKGSDTEKEATS